MAFGEIASELFFQNIEAYYVFFYTEHVFRISQNGNRKKTLCHSVIPIAIGTLRPSV